MQDYQQPSDPTTDITPPPEQEPQPQTEGAPAREQEPPHAEYAPPSQEPPPPQPYMEYAPPPPREKRRMGGYVVTALVAFLTGIMLTSLALPPILNWRRIREEYGYPTESADASDTADASESRGERVRETPAPTVRPEREVPPLGGTAPSVGSAGNSPVADIAESMGPSVVGVSNKVTSYVRGRRPEDSEQSSGSGIVLSEDGYIVTNNHVISGSTSISIVFAGGEEAEAEIVGYDKYTDLAVLKVNKSGLVPAPLGNSDNVRVGETAIAIGNPLGQELAGSVTVGVISAKDREINMEGTRHRLLQTDAAINPGNSGGPLVNSTGEVVGINTMKYLIAGYDDYGYAISTEGIGFAIPINQVLPIVESLIRDGHIERPYIGVSLLPVTPEDAELWKSPETIYITDVTAGGPAAIAGLKTDDILIECNGDPVGTTAEFAEVVRAHSVGDKLTLKVWRNGKTIELILVIGDLNSTPNDDESLDLPDLEDYME